MFESTMDALVHPHPKHSVGGYVIVDEYEALPACRQAVYDYREAKGIDDAICPIDWTAAYGLRSKP